MKATVALMACISLLLCSCASAPPSTTVYGTGTRPGTGTGISRLDIRLVTKGSLANTDERPLINVRNDVDRAVTVDFEGSRHYDISVGDHREGSLSVDEGTYRIRAAAPSFATVQMSATFSRGTAYDVVIATLRNEPR